MKTGTGEHAIDVRAKFSLVQERANAATHGIGAVLAVPALALLVGAASRRGDAWHIAAFSIFGSSMILLYLASTIYHATQDPDRKRIFEMFDHAAIFILIAGSYTAFALTVLRGSTGWWLFGAIWAIAVVGIYIETKSMNRRPMATLFTYLAMGWLIALVWKPLSSAASKDTLVFLLAGGLSYTFGTVFYGMGRRWGWFHVVWHLFVIGGTVCHFLSAMSVLPPA